MKRILILHTGGTISMSQDADGAVRPDKKILYWRQVKNCDCPRILN